MNARVPLGVYVLPILLSSGCASLNPSPAPPAAIEPDPVEDIRAAIADRPAMPGAAQMLPTVELVSFPFRSDAAARRDTIRGAVRVVSWLERLERQTADSVS